MSRVIKCDLNAVVGSGYDKARTTTFGNAFQKTINSKLVLGPSLNLSLDAFTNAGITPTAVHYTTNGRVFVMGTIATGAAQCALFTVNPLSGATAYVGKIQMPFPNTAATTHTVRSFRVLDTGTTGWKIWVGTTGSVLLNGGPFQANNIDLSDFAPVSFTTIPFATGSNQKAMYMLQDPAGHGSANTNTATSGCGVHQNNSHLIVHNGVSATHQILKFDYSIAPNNIGQTVDSFTIASPGKVNLIAHGYAANDMVTLSTTGVLPTGLVAGTVYFVRNPGAGDFELSATTGGASINFTGSPSGVATVRRAFGQSSSSFLLRTGNLPALTGTLLLTNSEEVALMDSGPLSGFDSYFFATTTAVYAGKLSELTAGVTSWASLATVNLLGVTNEFVTPTAAFVAWSNILQKFAYITNTAAVVIKGFVNNLADAVLGSLSTQYLEAMPGAQPELGLSAIISLDVGNGWIVLCSSTVGQRVVVMGDARSHYTFDYSTLISKVIKTYGARLKSIFTLEELYDITSTAVFYYRTAPAGDVLFDSETGGWIEIGIAQDLSSIVLDDETQFKIQWFLLDGVSANPAQYVDLLASIDLVNETSDNWEFSKDKSDSGVPTKYVFRLKQLYSGAVPTLFVRAHDLSNNSISGSPFDTVTHAAQFRYSITDGASWVNLGVIPNAVGTLVEFTFITPPGVDNRPSIRET